MSLFTHRRYLFAAALGQAALVLKRPAYLDVAQKHAQIGIEQQWPDGVNPERGGFDVGYQMIGVLMALRYYAILANGRSRRMLENSILKASDRATAMLRSDGSFDLAGNTRVGIEIGRSGGVKTIPYAEIFEALIYQVHAFKRSELLAKALKIATYNDWIDARFPPL
jgi:hypothetical protein